MNANTKSSEEKQKKVYFGQSGVYNALQCPNVLKLHLMMYILKSPYIRNFILDFLFHDICYPLQRIAPLAHLQQAILLKSPAFLENSVNCPSNSKTMNYFRKVRGFENVLAGKCYSLSHSVVPYAHFFHF